jgi:branched-chain amino acid transport system substrate-binding protein
VIFGGYHPEASKIVTQMRKKGMDTIFISDDGVKDVTFIKVAGEFAEGVYATGPVDTSKNPIAVEAIEAHKKEFGEDPGAFYLNAYAATQALLNAIEKSGSTDFDVLKKTLQSEWVATPLGIIKFDERGDAIGVGFAVYQVQGGSFATIEM